eukprot:179055_1
MSGDESKTRGFWKDNRVVMIMLALVCVAAFSIIAYKLSRPPSVDQVVKPTDDVVQSTNDEEQPMDDVESTVDEEPPVNDVKSTVAMDGKHTVDADQANEDGSRKAIKGEMADLVKAVKDQIQAMDEDIPSNRQRLIFKAKQLKDGRTLADYNIPKGSMISLFVGSPSTD